MICSTFFNLFKFDIFNQCSKQKIHDFSCKNQTVHQKSLLVPSDSGIRFPLDVVHKRLVLRNRIPITIHHIL